MSRILLVEDDILLAKMLKEYLVVEGFEVAIVSDGLAALKAASHADAIVLDVMLPGLNGVEVLRKIRRRSNVPILMLSARGEEVDRIVGLEGGADDYIPKPCHPRELVARLRGILKRSSRLLSIDDKGPEKISIADLELHVGERLIMRDGEPIDLTTAEFNILELLMTNAGIPVSKHTLARYALGREHTPLTRSIDIHISHLRRKLGPALNGRQRIKTIHGKGYMYVQVS